MANEKRLIDAKPIVQFIMDGLNHPIPLKAFGNDAIKILTEIEFAPTVDAVEVVHGKWVWADDEECGLYRCSCCIGASGYPTNYCPNCGAKMDGDGNG